MAARSGHRYSMHASKVLVYVLDDCLCIAIGFLGLPGYLLAQTFDLLLFAADQFPDTFLHFSRDVLYNTFDLFLVHDLVPSFELAGCPCRNCRLNVMLPVVCAVTNPQTIKSALLAGITGAPLSAS